MEISITQQCQTFLLALLLGAALSLLYDGFRLLRLILPEQCWRINLEDIFYCLLCAFFTLHYALEWEQGRLRSYLLLGELLGWLLCHFTLGQLIYETAKVLFRWLWRCIFHPLTALLGKILAIPAKIIKKLGKICKKSSVRAKFFLKRRGLLLYNLIKSEKRPIFRKR